MEKIFPDDKNTRNYGAERFFIYMGASHCKVCELLWHPVSHTLSRSSYCSYLVPPANNVTPHIRHQVWIGMLAPKMGTILVGEGKKKTSTTFRGPFSV